jgi:hypothetical protein
MDFLGTLVEIGDGLIDRKLNAELATVLVDFGLYLVGLWERCLLIPDPQLKDMRRFLINGRNYYGLETLGTRFAMVWRRSVVV